MSFDEAGFAGFDPSMITDEQLTRVAMHLDPMPVLRSAQMPPAQPMMPPAVPELPGPGTWQSVMEPSGGGSKVPGQAPLDFRSLQMLQSMMPRPAQPHFIGAGSVQRPAPMNIQAQMPPGVPVKQVSPLAALMGR